MSGSRGKNSPIAGLARFERPAPAATTATSTASVDTAAPVRELDTVPSIDDKSAQFDAAALFERKLEQNTTAAMRDAPAAGMSTVTVADETT